LFSFSELVAQFETRLGNSQLFHGQPENLYEPCRYLLGLGGKRVRPALCLMGAELFGDLTEDAWQAAIGIELFHNFTLIHDDIMDKAPLRRGQPTIHARNGLTAGILCGDTMGIAAYQQMSRVQHKLHSILDIFNRTAIEVCEGQQMDMDFEQRDDVTEEEYIRMIKLKTSVLVAASLKIGAITGGSTGGNAEKLYQFGKYLGIAFQLQDDYLDAFGDANKLGKQAGGDILADKKTYLQIKAMEHLTPDQKASLQSWHGNQAEGKVEATLELFRLSSCDKQCREAVEHYSGLAFQALEDVACLSKRKQYLHDLAMALLDRQS